MRDEDLVFYDIEVFQYDSLVVLKDINHNILGSFWNNRSRMNIKDDPTGFEGVEKIIEGKILVGYNNYNYDDKIIKLMRNGAYKQSSIFHMNEVIIAGNDPGITPDVNSIDTMQQIDVSMPSLKLIEGNLGKNIMETPITFSIDRTLTDDERKLVEKYCCMDIDTTIEVYKLRKKSYFDVKESLISMLDEDKRHNALKWNTTTIAAQILTKGKNTTLWQKHGIPKELWSEEFRSTSGIDPKVWEMWDIVTHDIESTQGKGKSVKQVTPFGTYVFGLGGLHGAPTKPFRCGRCKHKDVKSMYPSAIVRLKALDAVDMYDSMRKERVSIKKSDPVKAGALKLILNSVYGNFKNQYSTLNNPLASSTVCIYGQIALFTLCKRLYEEGHYEIINANTDGVVYVETGDSIKGLDDEICAEWEQQFSGFELETDYYKTWIQKDVNNYIAVDEDDKITVKGGEVNRYESPKIFGANNARIVQIVLVEKLLNPNKNTLDIIMEHLALTDDPDENIRREARTQWQFILRVGHTFTGTKNREGEWQQKVNRVFAAGPEGFRTLPSTKLYKVKITEDGESLINFPDAPEEMILWNDDVNNIENFSYQLDIGFYHKLIQKKLGGWK